MIRRLLAVFAVWLVLVNFAGATAFTAARSGEWNDQYTWGAGSHGLGTCGSTIPCLNTGDTVTIDDQYALTCGSVATYDITVNGKKVCSVGSTPATDTGAVVTPTHSNAAGSVRVYSGYTLVVGGSPTWIVPVTLDAGATYQVDSSNTAGTPVAYQQLFFSGTNYGGLVANGTSGSHAVVEGDSFYSPFNNTAKCATANIVGCMSGVFGNSTSAPAELLPITGTGYLDFRDVAGTVVSSDSISIFQTFTSKSSSLTQLHLYNSGSWHRAQKSSSTGNFLCDGCLVEICTATGMTDPCIHFGDTNGGSGTAVIRNSVFKGRSSFGGVNTNTQWSLTNVMYEADLTSGTSAGKGAGALTMSAVLTASQLFLWNNSYTSGASIPITYMRIPATAQRSVMHQWKVVGGNHLPSFAIQMDSALPANSTPYFFQHNVLGMTGPRTNSNQAVMNLMNPPTHTGTLTATALVITPGSDGRGSIGVNFNSVNSANTPITFTQNVLANTSAALNLNPTMPAGPFTIEGTAAAGEVASVDSNFIYSGVNGVQSTFCGSSSALTNIITGVAYNSFYNVNSTTSPAICPTTSGLSWVASAPTNETYSTVNGFVPLVAWSRTVLNFQDYLASPTVNLLPLSVYTGDANYQGSWSTGAGNNIHADGLFHAGDVVAFSNGAVYGGQTFYLRCILQHNPSSAAGSTPFTGFDASNIFTGHEKFWEPAWLPWFRTQVLAGTTFSDGSLRVSSTHATVQDNSDTGVIGLLQAYVENGRIGLAPDAWTAGKNGVEIGLPTHRLIHIAQGAPGS